MTPFLEPTWLACLFRTWGLVIPYTSGLGSHGKGRMGMGMRR